MHISRTIRRNRRSFGVRRKTTLLRAGLFAVAALAAQLPVLAQPVVTNTPAPVRPSVEQDIATLGSADTTPEVRSAAIRRLVASADPAAVQAIGRLLSPENRGNEAQSVAVRELGTIANVDPSLLTPLAAWLRESTPDRHAPLYRAISGIRTREAARLLLSYASPSAPVENRDAVYQSLTRLTGRLDLGPDRAAWNAWLTAMEQGSEEAWRQSLASNLGSRADALRLQRDEALRRLAEAERARVLSAPDVPTRSALLAALLRDELPTLRRLGIELVNRELANGKELGPAVGTATLDLLNDPSADVRSAGADLIDRLIPNGATVALRNALAREQNPNVLAKLLRLVRRFPDVAPPELLVGWLGADATVRQAAIDALAAMQDLGTLAAPVDLDRALRTLRSEQLEALSLDGLRLLCDLGDQTDRNNVAAMLASPSADVRLRAAQALAPFADRLDQLISAAQNDQTLFSVVASTLATTQPTYQGFEALFSLKAPTPAARREALNALAQRLPLPDLLQASEKVADPETREGMLARVINLTVPDPANPEKDPFKGPEGATLVEALFALARAQLEVTRPGAALGTLDLLPANDPELMRRAVPLQVEALLYLDQMEQALTLGGNAEAWLDGMEYAVTLPHALAIGSEIDYQFGSEMTPEQRTRLEELTKTARQPRPVRETSSSR